MVKLVLKEGDKVSAIVNGNYERLKIIDPQAEFLPSLEKRILARDRKNKLLTLRKGQIISVNRGDKRIYRRPKSQIEKPRHNIRIYQKGGNKTYNQQYIDACYYYLRKFTSPKMANKLHVRIEMRKTKFKKKTTAGRATAEVDGSSPTREFVIVLRPNRPFTNNLRTMAHECKHVAQRATNQLQYKEIRLPKGDREYGKYKRGLRVKWKGKNIGLKHNIPYVDRPWEKEARETAEKNYKGFPGYHKSGDSYEEFWKKYEAWRNKVILHKPKKGQAQRKATKRMKVSKPQYKPGEQITVRAKLVHLPKKANDKVIILTDRKGREVYRRYFTPNYDRNDMRVAIQRAGRKKGLKIVDWDLV